MRRATGLLPALSAALLLGSLLLSQPAAAAPGVEATSAARLPAAAAGADCSTVYVREPNPTVLVPYSWPGVFTDPFLHASRALAVTDAGALTRIVPPAAGGETDRVSVWAYGSSCTSGTLEMGGWSVTTRGVVQAWNHSGEAPPAQHHGDLAGTRLNAPVSGMAVTPTGRGYWLLGRDGGVFTFGDARFFGSTGAMRLNAPIIGMAATPSGAGYWLFASDGGIFTFGDARFHGSTGNLRLVAPVVGMSPTPTGRGYRLVARDGGVFTFGDATFRGSAASGPLSAPVDGILTRPTGYTLVGRDAKAYNF